LSELTGEFREVREDISQLTQDLQSLANTVKTLQEDYQERKDSQRWLVREIVGKLIWPAMALAAMALLWFKE
jgi:chromosome segregation ATPase